ncbi:hypothetical protein [Rubrolithibacter danxiaensis]|uniref:hypothetical protein n=1 Tax=Rubrolithibacter danxiaensis TaxID=3390805 RepID=UPI003BF7C4FE
MFTRSICIFLLLLPLVSFAQLKEEIKKQAQIIITATKNSDFETVISKTHPSLVAKLGGKEQMLVVIKEGMEKLASESIKIDTAVLGEPGEIFQAGEELHCLVPEVIVLGSPMGKLVSQSHLLAISGDEGLTWAFLDVGETITDDNIIELIPNFNRKLKIPMNPKPVLYKNKQ